MFQREVSVVKEMSNHQTQKTYTQTHIRANILKLNLNIHTYRGTHTNIYPNIRMHIQQYTSPGI